MPNMLGLFCFTKKWNPAIDFLTWQAELLQKEHLSALQTHPLALQTDPLALQTHPLALS
jgi:hypothetical protein